MRKNKKLLEDILLSTNCWYGNVNLHKFDVLNSFWFLLVIIFLEMWVGNTLIV